MNFIATANKNTETKITTLTDLKLTTNKLNPNIQREVFTFYLELYKSPNVVDGKQYKITISEV